MPYAALSDLYSRFGQEEIDQLADRDDDDVEDANVVDDALSAASSEIDSYLATRYEVPVTSISENLNKVCCDITRYLMHDDAATEEVEKRYNRAIAWLRDLSAGKAVLTGSDGKPIINGAPSGSGVKFKTNDRVFSDETLAGF